jgi:hypothetical protein
MINAPRNTTLRKIARASGSLEYRIANALLRLNDIPSATGPKPLAEAQLRLPDSVQAQGLCARALQLRLQNSGIPTLTTNDVINGYCVLTETPSSAVELPTNAVPVGNWHVHGASSPFGANKTDFPGLIYMGLGEFGF